MLVEPVLIGSSADQQDLSLLISQYLHTRPHGDVARLYDEVVLGVGRGKQHIADVEEVERAIMGTYRALCQ